MLEHLPFALLIAAVLLLLVLSAIDLKYWILPDELNLALALCGIAFHIVTGYVFVGVKDMILGAACGAGLLYIIRFFANRAYGRDTLGLGDVKLLAAGGLWLGLDGTLQAITVGAFAGLVQGILYAALISLKTKQRFSIGNLSIPAGPGFAVGLAGIGWFMFGDFAAAYIRELRA